MTELASVTWSRARLAEGLEVLARRAGYPVVPSPESIPALPTDGDELLWLELASGRLGLEVEAVSAPYPELESMLKHIGPAVIRLGHDESSHYLLLLRSGLRGIALMTPELKVVYLRPQVLATAMTAAMDALATTEIEQMLELADIAPERREQARRLILNERLAHLQVGDCWLLRLSPALSFWQQLRQLRVPRQLTGLLTAHVVQQGLQIVGWWVIIQGVLNGQINALWLGAWGLVLLTSVPFELLVIWLQSLLTVNVGMLLKQRLLLGTLQLRPEEVRHQGIGQFLGRVLESDTLETLVLGGGFTALIAGFELATAAVVLSFGVGGLLHTGLLIGWVAFTALLGWQFFHRSRRWRTGHRFMINALIERMVGHRTRLAQDDPQHWHDDEDQSLSSYLQLSKDMDTTSVQIIGIVNRGWLLLGLLGVSYPLLSEQTDLVRLAVSLGGIMLAAQALNRLTGGMENLVGAVSAWQQVGPLFRAATRATQESPSLVAAMQKADDPGSNDRQSVLVGKDLVFRYRDYGQPVLRGCDLTVQAGERLLLQGTSGGGKSTLAALITGLRMPTSGLLLLRGLDRQTLGSKAWRKRVVAVPQFHDNHVLSETFAFNLLMGRRWPPSNDDLNEAETVCRELGLGELLERMPAGLQQMVGESGWQLSHGERSRLFIARALLQHTDMIVLDESFAALDPENLERALRCVLRRAKTLLVIAHP